MTPSKALQKAVKLQKSSAQVLERVRRVGDNQAALVMLDRELGQRNNQEKSEKSKS